MANAPTFKRKGTNALEAFILKDMFQKKNTESEVSNIQSRGGVEIGRKVGGRSFKFPESGKFTAEAQNSVNNIQAQLITLDNMESMASKIKGGRIAGSILGGKAELTGGAGDYALAKLYQDSLPAAAVGYYRAATGDKGQTSDKDAAQRALPLFWKINESDDLKPLKFSQMKQTLLKRLQQVSVNPSTETVGPSFGPTENPIPGMQEQVSQPQVNQPQTGDKRAQYNQLRAQGIPADEAKRRLGF